MKQLRCTTWSSWGKFCHCVTEDAWLAALLANLLACLLTR